MDTQWRQLINKESWTNKTSILCLASKTHVFLIDLMNLGTSEALDKMLKKIVEHKDTTIMMFNF